MRGVARVVLALLAGLLTAIAGASSTLASTGVYAFEAAAPTRLDASRAASFIYDSPATTRVDDRDVKDAKAIPAQLKAAPKVPAPAPVEPRGTSTTSAGSLIATEEGPSFFRGARSGEAPSFEPRPNDFKVDPATGTVKPTHGVSVFDNPGSVTSKGFLPHEVDL